jgi:hypothetical protein
LRNHDYATQERILRMAHEFVREARVDLARAVREDSDLPPRIRIVHDRPGHTSPEYRTLAVPIPAGAGGASPSVLSGAIARYVRRNPPSCLMLVLDVIAPDERGGQQPLLIAEARDTLGNRLFIVQPFRVTDGRITWDEPLEGGWRDPGPEEMIIDAAFAPS